MITVELHDAISNHRNVVAGAVDGVEYAAESLRRVGMDKVADQLYESIRFLDKSAANISGAYSADLDKQIRHGEGMMGGILTAILNGNLVPTPSEGEVQ